MRIPLFTIGLAGWFLVVADSAQAAEATLVLTNAEQIRGLKAAESANQLHVRLVGVMMDTARTAANWRALILADQTAGIYVLGKPDAQGKNILAPYHRGDLLEISGVTDSGQFAPVVVAESARKLGTASIPPPQPATYQELITGALDAQWVEIKGLIRQYFEPEPGTDTSRVVIAVDGGLVQAVFTGTTSALQVDAEVKVQAICFYQFNQRRQVLNPFLQVPRGVPLVVEKPAPTDPYASPVKSPETLLTFSPGNLHDYNHRVHVRGVVTYSQPGLFIWIRDESAGLRIQTSQSDVLSAGDKIEVLGFPTFGLNAPELGDAVFRKAGSTRPPQPITLKLFDEAFDHEEDLVEADGTLTQIQPFLNGISFTLDKGGQFFQAVLKTSPEESSNPDWQVGDKVRITGICTMTHEDAQTEPGIWQPKTFQILLRSPADFQIVQPPPWWTPEHITLLLGMATGTLALLIGVIVVLSRQRLRQQAYQRHMAEAEFAAILSERNRLAREIHDTLAQGLTATSVQLRLAKKNVASAKIGRHLDAALALVSDSLEEARNSIWNMRANVLESGKLTGALEGILAQMANDTEIETHFEVSGKPRQLAPVIENNILRIGQEAITNAIKHSSAKQIRVNLEYGDEQFRLSVQDNGHGFDPQKPPISEGGFGLVGMRERVAESKGEIRIQSEAGKGSEVMVTIPLAGT